MMKCIHYNIKKCVCEYDNAVCVGMNMCTLYEEDEERTDRYLYQRDRVVVSEQSGKQ